MRAAIISPQQQRLGGGGAVQQQQVQKCYQGGKSVHMHHSHHQHHLQQNTNVWKLHHRK